MTTCQADIAMTKHHQTLFDIYAERSKSTLPSRHKSRLLQHSNGGFVAHKLTSSLLTRPRADICLYILNRDDIDTIHPKVHDHRPHALTSMCDCHKHTLYHLDNSSEMHQTRLWVTLVKTQRRNTWGRIDRSGPPINHTDRSSALPPQALSLCGLKFFLSFSLISPSLLLLFFFPPLCVESV